MYDFIDVPVSALDPGGRFLVWSMRSWVVARGGRQCPADLLAGPFCQWNMLSGLQPFLRMMALMNRHGLENFGFCAMKCDHVSEHEAILLSLMCSLRDGRADRVRETLELLVEDEAIGDLVDSLHGLGRCLDDALLGPQRPVTRHCVDGADDQRKA